ncbi:MAG: glycoside hydrolase, partial [Armatimonadota bacterium]
MLKATVRVATNLRYQRMENFGASGAWSIDPIGKEWSEENKNRLADLLFSREEGIGLSLWRFNIGAGGALTDQLWAPWRGAEVFKADERAEYDWSKHAGQQWFLRAAQKRGVERF